MRHLVHLPVALMILTLAAPVSADPTSTTLPASFRSPQEGLPLSTAPLGPHYLASGVEGAAAAAGTDLSGTWEGEIGGQPLRATFTRDPQDPNAYTIEITLPDGSTQRIQARLQGDVLLTVLLAVEDAAEQAADEIAQILDELSQQQSDSRGMAGALEDMGEGGSPEAGAEQPAPRSEPTSGSGGGGSGGGGASPSGGGASPSGGGGSPSGGASSAAQPEGSYGLSNDGDDLVLDRKGGAPDDASQPSAAPASSLRRTSNSADTIETMALALGIWTEARDARDAGTRQAEMTRVGGVILNRAATRYRGKSTVLTVVLDRSQFSHFNSRSNAERRALESGDVARVQRHMGARSRWDEALAVARGLQSGATPNPWTDSTVRHYYSPRSMVPRNSVPAWAISSREVRVANISRSRFRWYRGIR